MDEKNSQAGEQQQTEPDPQIDLAVACTSQPATLPGMVGTRIATDGDSAVELSGPREAWAGASRAVEDESSGMGGPTTTESTPTSTSGATDSAGEGGVGGIKSEQGRNGMPAVSPVQRDTPAAPVQGRRFGGHVVCPTSRYVKVADLQAEYRMSRSAAYKLGRFVPAHKVPGVGLCYLRAEVDEHFAAGRRPIDRLSGDGAGADSADHGRRRRTKATDTGWVAAARRFGLA